MNPNPPTTPAISRPFWASVMAAVFFLSMALALVVTLVVLDRAIANLKARLAAELEAGDV